MVDNFLRILVSAIKWTLNADFWNKNSIAVVALLISILSAIGTGGNAFVNALNFHRTGLLAIESDRDYRLQKLYQEITVAEQNACISRSSANGSHTFTLSLETAAIFEKQVRNDTPAFVYHALADLGSNKWDFHTIKSYCDLAIERSTSSYDLQLSYQQLACAHFDFYQLAAAEDASLSVAREYFQKATEVLRKAKQRERATRLLGQAFELWAAHEVYRGNFTAGEEKRKLAIEAWSDINSGERLNLLDNLESHLKEAKAGVHPKSPCRVGSIGAKESIAIVHTLIPFSNDRSLGKVIDGKLHMHFVEYLPRDLDAKVKNGAVEQTGIAIVEYETKIFLLIHDDLTAPLPTKRYFQFDSAIGVSGPQNVSKEMNASKNLSRSTNGACGCETSEVFSVVRAR